MSTEQTAQHTQTPWKIKPGAKYNDETYHDVRGPNLELIAEVCGASGDEEETANAEFIILACNAHDEFVAACREMIRTHGMHGPCDNNDCSDCNAAYNKAVAILTKAGG